jgi:DNA gyrase subunit B
MGNQERYIEKESQLEEILIRDRAKDIEVTDRSGESFRVTEARHQRLVRALTEFDGWLARLRADFGSSVASFVVSHRLIELDASTPAEVDAQLGTLGDDIFELQSAGATDTSVRVKLVERETSAATHIELSSELLTSTGYVGLRRVYKRLVEIAGAPPFGVTLGKKSRSAGTFDDLRTQVLDLAKEGIQISRFKGLGEMNPEELWETTMNPDNRMLIQVGVEDALLADRIFSMLMGDQVEPRREFIEQNAKFARLDV